MTVRGVARLVARTAADFFRGVALCCREMASDVADDIATLVHLNDAIRDAFTNSLDDQAGPANLPDPDTTQARYTQTVTVAMRGHSETV